MFCLFQPLQNSLKGKNFDSLKDCKGHLGQFSAQKDKMFWEEGTMKFLKNGRRQWNKMGCSIKFLVKMKGLFFNLKI